VGPFAGSPLLLLHTTGVRSGRERINPLMYQDLGDGGVAAFASANSAPTHPDWYHNLVAYPTIMAEIGTEARRFRAYTATGGEREAIWSRQKQASAGFAGFGATTDRKIPVVIFEQI
jgi:deazaflavin-dependent oxidoreductase (nitroreductase family)